MGESAIAIARNYSGGLGNMVGQKFGHMDIMFRRSVMTMQWCDNISKPRKPKSNESSNYA